MNHETSVSLDDARESTSLSIFTCTYDECQVVLMALGELLASVQREEHLVPMIHSLIQRVEDAQNIN